MSDLSPEEVAVENILVLLLDTVDASREWKREKALSEVRTAITQEREACAKVAEGLCENRGHTNAIVPVHDRDKIASAIRARGEETSKLDPLPTCQNCGTRAWIRVRDAQGFGTGSDWQCVKCGQLRSRGEETSDGNG